jgi:hypothetical protein
MLQAIPERLLPSSQMVQTLRLPRPTSNAWHNWAMLDESYITTVKPAILHNLKRADKRYLHIHQKRMAFLEIALSQANSHWQDGLRAYSVALHPFSGRCMTFLMDDMSSGNHSSLRRTHAQSAQEKS